MPSQGSPLSPIHSQDGSESSLLKPELPRSSPLLTAGQLQKQWSGSNSLMEELAELESPHYPSSLLTLQSSTFSVTDDSRSPLASSPIESTLSTLASQSALPAATQQSSASGSNSGPSLNASSPWPGIWRLVTVVPLLLSPFVSLLHSLVLLC